MIALKQKIDTVFNKKKKNLFFFSFEKYQLCLNI